MRSGVILAGGRSTRFGDTDKAVADLAGTPMIRRVADRVARVTGELVVNCRADQREAIRAALADVGRPVSVAIDPESDRGPMAGIAAGLDAAAGDYAAVVACDMPFVDPSFLDHLFDRAAGHDAAVPRPGEWFETTQAVYRTTPMAAACERALAAGEGRIVSALFELDYVVVGREETEATAAAATFEDLNTREAFEAAASRL
jgi:molybdopterin-guanine dinucleotide biosynthesis protein A